MCMIYDSDRILVEEKICSDVKELFFWVTMLKIMNLLQSLLLRNEERVRFGNI